VANKLGFVENSVAGLRELSALILNIFLDNKGNSSVKKTNWDNMILTEEQINYAILDVYVSVEIFNEMSKNSEFKQCVESSKLDLKLEKIDKTEHCKKIIEKHNTKKEKRQELLENEDLKFKKKIDNMINKWIKGDKSKLKFEPMNSYYRNYIYSKIKNHSEIKAKSVGSDSDFSRKVILKKPKLEI
jgi:hypothetical protein